VDRYGSVVKNRIAGSDIQAAAVMATHRRRLSELSNADRGLIAELRGVVPTHRPVRVVIVAKPIRGGAQGPTSTSLQADHHAMLAAVGDLQILYQGIDDLQAPAVFSGGHLLGLDLIQPGGVEPASGVDHLDHAARTG
jgi:hypothetical protein